MLQELVPGLLWTDSQPMAIAGLQIGRRLTVARGARRQLVVFSPLQASAARIAELNALGPLTALVVPSRSHELFFDGYFEACQEARCLAGPGTAADHPDWAVTLLPDHAGALDGFRYQLLGGMPRVQEYVFLHEVTRTLILADALFNLPVADRWFTRGLMALADMGGRPRPSRLFRALIKSKPEFRASIDAVLQWDFDRVIGGHGEVIPTGGKDAVRTAFSGV